MLAGDGRPGERRRLENHFRTVSNPFIYLLDEQVLRTSLGSTSLLTTSAARHFADFGTPCAQYGVSAMKTLVQKVRLLNSRLSDLLGLTYAVKSSLYIVENQLWRR